MTLTHERSGNCAVIMAGGRGTRFWPWSRETRPKQFLAMMGTEPMLRQSVLRLLPDFPPERIWIATTGLLAEEVRRMLPELPAENVLIEPEGRNTAPCLALALVTLERKHPEATMVVLSSDHWIGDEAKFLADIRLACTHARTEHRLCTFGIPPAYPETGFGYIETAGGTGVQPVLSFREKPTLEVAETYVHSGRHYWNAGMFAWTLADFRAELLRLSPEMLAPLDAWQAAGAPPSDLAGAYGQLPRLSIDYALMEKSDTVSVVPASFRWSDVGSWPAAMDFLPQDGDGNAVRGSAVLLNSTGCAVFGQKRLVAGSGLEDLIIVDSEDALLICRRDRAQDVKMIVDKLQAMGRGDLL
jgi:mannose-1-phosphate guanylyltransferase